MSKAISKGILLGACNVLCVATLVGISEAQHSRKDGVDAAVILTMVGMVPGLLVGGVLGRVLGQLDRWRVTTVTAVALLAVCVMGMSVAPELIAMACVPTAIMASALERWTRADLIASRMFLPSRLSNATKGALVGALNVTGTAAMIGAMVWANPPLSGYSGDPEEIGFGFAPYVTGAHVALQIIAIIMLVGIVPGVGAGACAGRLATELGTWRTWARVVVLSVLSVSAVTLLGVGTGQAPFVLPACVPAVITALILERWTRVHTGLPVATIR